MCGGGFSGFMHCEGCMMVNRRVVSLGSFMSSEATGRSRMALRESRDVRKDVLGLVLSPSGSLAMIPQVDCMCSV